MRDAATDKIRVLNDAARQSFTGCRVLITPGIQALDDMAHLLDQVRWYDAFTLDNDPYHEHDFGSFRHGDDLIFWKWEYFDVDMTMHSPDPADETVTARVLTIMLAEEY